MDQGIHMLDLMLFLCGNFEYAKAYASNRYWKTDVEDNLFAIMQNNKGQCASLHSTMTQWRYLFALEIFLEKGYVVVNGLLSKSMRYGQEVLSYSINRKQPPTADHAETISITFDTDSSWRMECDEFFNAILTDKDIHTGNSSQALELMTLVEKIYADAGML